jgi:AraC-like DNA-binding protein
LKWEYYTLLPTKQFLSRMFEVRLIVLFLLVLLLMVGIAGAVILSINHYRPIRNLEEHIRVLWNPQSYDSRISEWERMQNTIDQAFRTHTDLVERMGTLNPYVREQVLIRLIKGNFHDKAEMAAVMPLEELGMTGNRFYAMLIVMGSAGESSKASSNKDSLYEIINNLAYQGAVGHAVELVGEDFTAVLVNITQEETDERSLQEKTARLIYRKISEHQADIPVIGIGTVYDEPEHIHRSFIEASAALEYRLIAKKGKPIFFEDISSFQEESLWYPLEEQARLIQSIKQGNKDVALETAGTILGIIGTKEQSFLFVKYMCFDVVNLIIRTIHELGAGDRFAAQLRRILEFTTLFELEDQLKELISVLCEMVAERKEIQQSSLKENIGHYIQVRFDSADLSLNSLGERFGLSVSYLSRLIKEQTGQTFTDYISGLRMEKVKRELVETDKPIKEIISGSGYLDVPNFTRKFRQLEGITPGQYRKMFAKP